jgi:LPXTG-motif cell wall-anchored protein
MKHSYGSGNSNIWTLTLTDTWKLYRMKLANGNGTTVTIPKSPSWDYTFRRTTATTGSLIYFTSTSKSLTSQSLLIWNAAAKNNQPVAIGAPTTDSFAYYAYVKTESSGTCKIKKTVDDGGTLAGFRFRVTGVAGTATAGYNSGWVNTNTLGEISLTLYPGSYKVEEDGTDAVRKGYKMPSPAYKSITVSEGATATVSFLNKAPEKKTFSLQKITDDGGTLAGFTFNVRQLLSEHPDDDSGDTDADLDDEDVDTTDDADAETESPPEVFDKSYVTDESGFITDDIPAGTYTVTEVMTEEQAQRYRQPEAQTVTISEENPSASVEFTNVAKRGNIRIIKTADDGRVAGITFLVEGTGKAGEAIDPFFAVTDEDGIISEATEGLIPNTYVITEQSVDDVADNYYLPQEPQTVTVKDGETADVRFHNKLTPHEITVSKQDAMTGEELSGAALQVLTEEGKVVEAWTSTDEPYLVENLEYGEKYILHEDLAPLGYELAQDMEFVVGDAEKVVMVDAPTQVFIEKKDKLSKATLKDCVIEIIDDETDEVVATLTSGEELASVNLVDGRNYRLHEVKAPKGYELAAEDVKFTAANGETATLYDVPTIPDKKMPKTGDSGGVGLALLIMGISGLAIAGILILRRRLINKLL